MRTEPVYSSGSEQAVMTAPDAVDANAWMLIQELQSENKRLREIVVYLGEIIIRGVVDPK